jgi:phosphoserine phosphatase
MKSYSLLRSPPDNGRPTVAVDLEGTLTAGSAWRGMYNYLLAHSQGRGVRGFYYGRLPEYFARRLTGRDMREFKNRWINDLLRLFSGYSEEERLTGRDMREFKNRWINDLLRLFSGYSEEEFQEMATWAVENELWPKRRHDLLAELGRHQQNGRRIIVVTGLYEPYVAALVAKLPGFEAIGTPVIVENGRLTGELATPFNVGEKKVEKLQPFMSGDKIFGAYGDTAADRFMLAISQHPVAVHPDKALRRLAQVEGWRIMDGEKP